MLWFGFSGKLTEPSCAPGYAPLTRAISSWRGSDCSPGVTYASDEWRARSMLSSNTSTAPLTATTKSTMPIVSPTYRWDFSQNDRRVMAYDTRGHAQVLHSLCVLDLVMYVASG